MAAVRVSRKGADRVGAGHPWIFSSDVLSRGEAAPGDAVRVVDQAGKPIGIAHYSSTSQITLRMLASRVQPVDEKFITQRLESALAFRMRTVLASNAYRLVHAEGDLLPGLIVDRYADWLAVQLLDQGMDRLAPQITNALVSLLNPAGIVARNDVPTRAKENLPEEVSVLTGEVPDQIDIEMNGLRLAVDLLRGQKTGVFLDQRENYLAARRYAKGRVLDCFTGTGGFALHAAPVCDSVEGVDSSPSSLAAARKNAEVNSLRQMQWTQADVLDYLPSLRSAHRRFDMVIVDPPAFTKSRSAVEGAMRGYKEVNLRALQLLAPRGVLVSCSCSHHMSEASLLELIASAALDCGKTLRVLERRTQAQDHPILLTVPETHYLKCLIFDVL